MNQIFRKLGWMAQRSRKEAELRDELQFHLQEESEQAEAAGLIAEQAKSAARRELGNAGVQYAGGDYTQLLKDHHIWISMSRKANPWDNAACESFMKTLKCEEVYRTEYRHQAEARLRIGEFLERVYNQKRLHSALDYRPPAEFEREQRAAQKKEAAARRLIA